MSAATMVPGHPRRRGLPLLELTLLAPLVASSVIGTVSMPFVWARDGAANDAVKAALADPAFTGRAARAGYRVELGVDETAARTRLHVLAKCARANEAGPLPCGPFPEDAAHPGIPVEARP